MLLERFLNILHNLRYVKFLIIGDLHGRKPRIHFKDFDAIIAPGDFCDDREIIPFSKKWGVHVKKARANNETVLHYDDFIIKQIGKTKLSQLEKRSLKRGREILKYLNSFGKPVFLVPGNWDHSYGPTRIKDSYKSDYHYLKMFYDFWLGKQINEFLIKGLKNIYDCQYKMHKFDEFNIMGYGLSSAPESPSLKVKFDFDKKSKEKLKNSYRRILERLSKEYKKRDRKKPTIFISHNVPFDTKLDIVLNKKSYAYKQHLGSAVARWFCVKYKPLICIGGHIHEHHGKDMIGPTRVVNAGFGPKVNTFLEIKGKKISKLKFYRG
jgi:Icc-related predicted phosphoesterase